MQFGVQLFLPLANEVCFICFHHTPSTKIYILEKDVKFKPLRLSKSYRLVSTTCPNSEAVNTRR